MVHEGGLPGGQDITDLTVAEWSVQCSLSCELCRGERDAGWLSEVERAVGGQRCPGKCCEAGGEEGNIGSDSDEDWLWRLRVATVL